MQKEKLKKNLPRGMNSTNKTFLLAEDICKIVETCAKNGVRAFTYGPLTFNFGVPAASEPAKIGTQSPENVILEQEKVEKNVILTEEIATKEDQIAELLISDPLQAEELMEQGELELDSDDHEGLEDDGTTS